MIRLYYSQDFIFRIIIILFILVIFTFVIFCGLTFFVTQEMHSTFIDKGTITYKTGKWKIAYLPPFYIGEYYAYEKITKQSDEWLSEEVIHYRPVYLYDGGITGKKHNHTIIRKKNKKVMSKMRTVYMSQSDIRRIKRKLDALKIKSQFKVNLSDDVPYRVIEINDQSKEIYFSPWYFIIQSRLSDADKNRLYHSLNYFYPDKESEIDEWLSVFGFYSKV